VQSAPVAGRLARITWPVVTPVAADIEMIHLLGICRYFSEAHGSHLHSRHC